MDGFWAASAVAVNSSAADAVTAAGSEAFMTYLPEQSRTDHGTHGGDARLDDRSVLRAGLARRSRERSERVAKAGAGLARRSCEHRERVAEAGTPLRRAASNESCPMKCRPLPMKTVRSRR